MVEWVDGAILAPEPASAEMVQNADRQLRVRLPLDFLEVARLRQGARPEPGRVQLPDGSTVSVECLLHFEEEPFYLNIVARLFPLRGVLQKGVIPFAEDIGGDVFCFNYRKDPEHPTVLYWSVDTGPIHLADSFTDLVGLLTL